MSARDDQSNEKAIADLRRFLQAAATTGSTVRIIYHGGRQPGAARDIRPLDVNDETVVALDVADAMEKTFLLARIELPGRDSIAPAYDPDLNVPEESEGSIRWYYAAVEGESRINPDGTARQQIIAMRAVPGELVRLVHEPDDDEDPNGIRVYLSGGEQVGCLPRYRSEEMLRGLQSGYQFRAVLHRVTGGTPDKINRGLVLRVIKRPPDVSDEEFNRAIEHARTAPDDSDTSGRLPSQNRVGRPESASVEWARHGTSAAPAPKAATPLAPRVPVSRFKTREGYEAWKAQRGSGDSPLKRVVLWLPRLLGRITGRSGVPDRPPSLPRRPTVPTSSRPEAPTLNPASASPSSRAEASVTPPESLVKASRASTPDRDRYWVPAGQSVTVSGYRIPGGFLFVGRDLPAISGYQSEPALVDPALPVDHDNPNRAGVNMPYWPSYGAITPSDRAAYLEWLAGGRSQPDAYIGYVFLFFYGLERRVLTSPEGLKTPTAELRAIAGEVERLLAVYGARSGSFARYGGSFLSLLTVATQDTARTYEREPPARLMRSELDLLLKLGLGQAAADARPLPADWALAWVDATTRLPTAAARCPKELRSLFRVRYAEAFGEGLRLAAGRSKLAWTYTPASASFGGQFTVQLDVPNVADSTPPAKLVALAEQCSEDLDGYSRWVSRHGEAAGGLAALALLPAEIVASHVSEEVDALCQSLEAAMGTGSQAVVDTEPLVRAWPSGGDGKLAKADAVLLAQALERRGYGLEPDVRFGGRLLSAPGRAVAFRLSAGTPAAASREYEAATLLLYMAAVVAAADDEVTQAESGHVVDHLQAALHLTETERSRLTAHFAWLQLDLPGNAGIKKRVATLTPMQRQGIAKFLVTLAASDGRISPVEIGALTKIYRLLGLEPKSVYGDVNALGQRPAEEPAVVRSASPTREFAVPERPSVESPIVLDMGRVARTLADTASVAAILDEVFKEGEGVRDGSPKSEHGGTRPASDTQSREGKLLRSLGERAEWSRLEFERLAERFQLMPDGALERLNEAALERFGTPVCEGEDPIVIDLALIREMLA